MEVDGEQLAAVLLDERVQPVVYIIVYMIPWPGVTGTIYDYIYWDNIRLQPLPHRWYSKNSSLHGLFSIIVL